MLYLLGADPKEFPIDVALTSIDIVLSDWGFNEYSGVPYCGRAVGIVQEYDEETETWSDERPSWIVEREASDVSQYL